MVRFDFNTLFLLAWYLLLVFDRFNDTRDGRTGKTEKQDFLARMESARCNVCGFENGDCCLAGTRPSRDQEVTVSVYNLQLLFGKLHQYLLLARLLLHLSCLVLRWCLTNYFEGYAGTPYPFRNFVLETLRKKICNTSLSFLLVKILSENCAGVGGLRMVDNFEESIHCIIGRIFKDKLFKSLFFMHK